MKKLLFLNIMAVFMTVCEAILFFLIQMTSGELCEVLCYASVGISLAFSLLTFISGVDGVLLRLGLGLTVVADYFLILATPINEVAGVAVFSAVQMCYFVALLIKQHTVREKTVHILIRVLLVATIMPVAFAVLGERTDTLSLLSVFYYANLLCNIVFAFKTRSYGYVFAGGLLMLALCDLFLGLGYLGMHYLGAGKGSFLYWITHSGLNIPWLFYVPSCALIALSTLFINKKES